MERRAIAGLLADIARIEEIMPSPRSAGAWDEVGARVQTICRVATTGQPGDLARKMRSAVSDLLKAQSDDEESRSRDKLREYLARLRSEVRAVDSASRVNSARR